MPWLYWASCFEASLDNVLRCLVSQLFSRWRIPIPSAGVQPRRRMCCSEAWLWLLWVFRLCCNVGCGLLAHDLCAGVACRLCFAVVDVLLVVKWELKTKVKCVFVRRKGECSEGERRWYFAVGWRVFPSWFAEIQVIIASPSFSRLDSAAFSAKATPPGQYVALPRLKSLESHPFAINIPAIFWKGLLDAFTISWGSFNPVPTTVLPYYRTVGMPVC
jgi:hypothetical protein